MDAPTRARPSDIEKAKQDYQDLLVTLRNSDAQQLVGATETYQLFLDKSSKEVAELSYELARQLGPTRPKDAQKQLQDAVDAQPNSSVFRFYLAEIARNNKDYARAYENYLAVTRIQPANPDLARKSADAIALLYTIPGADLPKQTPMPAARPRPTMPVAVAQTPAPPAPAATPQPTPALVLTPLPDNAPSWRRWIYTAQTSPYGLKGREIFGRVLQGEFLEFILGIPAFILFFWVVPYQVLRRNASRGSVIAGQYVVLSKKIGLLAWIPYTFTSLKTHVAVKNRCPFCNKGVDNIDSYSDLNFYCCPHCKENITPIYDMRDYVMHLIDQLEIESKRHKGGGMSSDSNIEKDAMLKLMRGILTLCIRKRASDLHIDAETEGAKIRARIDGMMYDMLTVPRAVSPAVISALKVMANLDITERRMPQDGKASVWIDKNDLDLRINTSPAAMGEKVSVRILNQKSIQVDPTKLGLEADNLEKYERSIRRPHGLIIVTGPSGSGKSTTLYVAINEINTGEKNIITLEDPIEYQLKGITQMQVNPSASFTFATGLRSILRQDPDIIMVGEIRDKETAEIAIEAAMTGHLVFTTLHTIDAPTAFSRLADLGIETRRVSSAVVCVIAQRLLRTICPECKKPYKPKKTDLELLGIASRDIMYVHGGGCEACMNTGYMGRMAIFEFLCPDESMREILEANASAAVIRELARKTGYRTLREEGIIKIMQGITTVEEVIRVTT